MVNWEEREKTLEAEVKTLKTQVTQLLAENGRLEEEKIELEESGKLGGYTKKFKRGKCKFA